VGLVNSQNQIMSRQRQAIEGLHKINQTNITGGEAVTCLATVCTWRFWIAQAHFYGNAPLQMAACFSGRLP